jgi:RHS repeat-associated protein
MIKKPIILLAILFNVTLSAKTMSKINIPLNGNAFVIQNYQSGQVSHIGNLSSVVPSPWAVYQNTPQLFNSFTNTLELDQIESASLIVDFDYRLKIKGTLNVWKIGSIDSVVTPNITLEINYDPNTLKTSRRIDYYSYSNAYKSQFIIDSVIVTSQSLNGPALYDKVSRIVELNFSIVQRTFSKPVFADAPLFQSPCLDPVTNELILSWSAVDFAEEYELEVTFRDNYTSDINIPLSPSAITYDFKENSTRIVTSQNYYRLPLVYERGYLLYRVRAVGMGGGDWNKRIPCAWSVGDSFGLVSAFTNKYGPIPAHVGENINWQLSTTYSDDGKRKDVVQYYDGLNMSRQTVTGVSQVKNLFTERAPTPISIPTDCTLNGSEKIKEIIAQEVIYDFNGRPALQILPVPTGTNKITYITKLNKNLAGNAYSWKDFDTLKNCLLTAQPLSEDSSGYALGAGAYYSPNNPNKLGYNAFIPDSKGYPFSRTQYTFDNTGRTYRQSGVGIVHELDIPGLIGHETKFYYAKPNQVELDRMFGNEVGYAIRYQKNMVVDPNGQVSVSYLNPEGKTIATALTGLKPDNLLVPDNESNLPVTISVDLLASNTPDYLEHSLTVNEQFVVDAQATYNFNYTVNGEKLSYPYCRNNNICLDCIYDLDIKLISNESCSTIPILPDSTFGELINPQKPHQLIMNLSCSNIFRSTDPHKVNKLFSKILPIGSYTLVKTLKVNKSAADQYVNLVFKDTCQSVLSNFIKQEMSKIDTMGCYQSCSTCKDANEKTPQNCNDLCPAPMNECDRARLMMLSDVSPGGQYAQYDITTINNVTVYDAGNYPLSVFNPANLLPSHVNWISLNLKLPDSTLVPDLQSLILNWNKEKFPSKFLPYHPEYRMLGWCDTLNFGKDYDLKLSEAQTYQEADSASLFQSRSDDPIYKQILDNDPFFHTTPNISLGHFLDFLARPCEGTESLDELAEDAAYCQASAASQAIISNAQNSPIINASVITPDSVVCVIPSGYHDTSSPYYHTFGSDPALKDYEWQNLRNLYLHYKEKYLYESRRDYSIDKGCFNGCIGVQHFFFNLSIPNFPNPNIYPNFPGTLPSSYHNGYTYSVEGYIPVNSSDICGFTRALYEYKVKRFTNRYDAFSHTTSDIPINLTGINLYDQCATQTNINAIKPQVAALVSQNLCASTDVPPPSGGGCWTDDFTAMLNQYLKDVTLTHYITLTGSQITSGIMNLSPTIPNFQIATVLIYCNTANQYVIRLKDHLDTFCDIKFPAVIVNGALKPIHSICCATVPSGGHTIVFKINYNDGTNTTVTAQSQCIFPSCAQVSVIANPTAIQNVPLQNDLCSHRSQLSLELFSFLEKLKVPTTPQSGIYHGNGNSQLLDHFMDPLGPVKYSMNQSNCVLTFSPSRSDERMPPCSITFSSCDWMNSYATLISIEPFFAGGNANVVTHDFIITYCRGNSPEKILSIKGNSGCFPINDCNPPYFCGNDTIPKLPPNNYNACIASKKLTAEFIAHSRYDKWIDSLKNDLLAKYYAKCMKAIETMHYNYPDRQFHYTLYYYDQAGNLVRTVPPAGVHLLAPALSGQIDNGRDSHIFNASAGITSHTLVTNYDYNSLNQIKWQITPDAGKTIFYYDKLGRIAASQNAKQYPNDYSYTWYDKLGRIVEGGKIHLSGSLDLSAVSEYYNWKTYIDSIANRSEITFTQYDSSFSSAVSAKFGLERQQNLRGRVASIMAFADKAAQTAGNYSHATHYTYDVTGNVPIILQDYRNTPLGTKAIAYNFDLLTGKVNEVRYEPGQQDEFRHKYNYDDELRLTKVSTSKKGIVWETEAEYFYYKHGPLARTELGELKVQGLDYIYTLQGWIKAVNGTELDRTQDAGRDGISLNNPIASTDLINGQTVPTTVETDPNYNSNGSGNHSLHNPVAADAFGYVLGYFNDPVNPDYTPIDPTASTTTSMDGNSIGDVKPLFDGNISRMYTWLQGQNLSGLGMNYRYDQLNRLKSQEGFTIASGGGQSLLGNGAYGMNLIYNPNGNIWTLDRRGRVTNPAMDRLTYIYYPGTNKLASVHDAVNSSYPEPPTPVNGTVTDIDNQMSPFNYTYDAIGNLIKDNSEGITSINWNIQNKITGITKTGAQIDFAYDALGVRVYKKYHSGGNTTETYYVRDAQGNSLATYEMKNGQLFWQEQDLYGNSRLGIWHPGTIINSPTHGLDSTIDWQNIKSLTTAIVEDSTIRGSKQYELTNHLGNVLATISDRRLQSLPAIQGTSGITADLISATDYYAFGMQMPGRNFIGKTYRYGFNGKENDNDIKGDGNQQDYGFRIYDPRLGRFLSVDPISNKYPELTPYQFASNKPIRAVDLDGLESLDFDMGGYIQNWFGDAFIGMATWVDNTLSYSASVAPKIKLNEAKVGSVTNTTSVILTASASAYSNFGDKLTYLKRNNTSQGDPTPFFKVKTELEVEAENETKVAIKSGVTNVEVYNSTSVKNDKTVKHTKGVDVSTVAEGIPVVVKVAKSTNSEGTKQNSVTVGVGNLDAYVGAITTNTTDKTGTTTSVGVTGQATAGAVSVTGTATVDIHSETK